MRGRVLGGFRGGAGYGEEWAVYFVRDSGVAGGYGRETPDCPPSQEAKGVILPSEGRNMPTLNLKNPRVYELAAELAELTGESLTSAVLAALDAKVREERRKREGGRTTAGRILAFAEGFAPGMAAGGGSAGHAELLYGEDGMPQ